MAATLNCMSSKKKQTDRHKPNKSVRVPLALANALELLAEEEYNSLHEQVKIAVREYLDRKGRLPRPTKS